MSGCELRPVSRPFRGADLSAVMGGIKLDLTDARMEGDSATIEVFAFWGGIEIYVPPDWTVTSKVTTLLGGFIDKRRPTSVVPTKTLIVQRHDRDERHRSEELKRPPGMHPILKRRSRLFLYLAVWIVFGLLLTVVFIFGGRAPPLWSLYVRGADGGAARPAVAVVLVPGAVHAAGRYAGRAHGRHLAGRRAGLAGQSGWRSRYVWAQFLLPDGRGPIRRRGGGHSRRC